jgi:uncharacterized protein (DUF885 family)
MEVAHVMRLPLIAVVACLTTLSSLTQSAEAADDRARVTALADRFVAEYQVKFPISYAFSGLPIERHDGIDINAPADIANWHELMKGMTAEVDSIKPDAFADQPEWVTWQFLKQALREDAETAVCREELWSVSAFGWQATLSQVATIQPLGTDEARAQALTRWRKTGGWVDQEIANLKEGQRLGYSATQATVQATLGQLDELLAGVPEKSAFMEPTERDQTPAFVAEWTKVVKDSVWPAFERYRSYLRDQYLPHARSSPSIQSHPNGRQCYRAQIFSTVTIDTDPVELFDVAVRKVADEEALAVRLGRGIYGDKAKDWDTLAALMRDDPRNKFSSADEVRAYTQSTYERAYAARSRMVLTPPDGQVTLEPFAEYQQASAPGGQYQPAAEDGSRPAVYYYRNVAKDLYKASLQNVILHETFPGHHLQIAFLAEHGRKNLHPIARLLFFSGPGEGWATYSEDFAREIGLYDSDYEYIGTLMASITPMMVVDVGMQVKGWTTDQAIDYIRKAMPMRPPERAVQSVATISGLPGFVLAYPMGGMQWEKMRARAEQKLGKGFDVRAFHQVLLEDGMLPFSALEAKLDRWIARGGK